MECDLERLRKIGKHLKLIEKGENDQFRGVS